VVWSCKKGNGGSSVKITWRNGSVAGKIGSGMTTWKDIVKVDLELLGVDENLALDRTRLKKTIASSTPTWQKNMNFKRKWWWWMRVKDKMKQGSLVDTRDISPEIA